MGKKKPEVDFHNSHHILEELKKDGKLKIEFARAMEIKVDVVRGDHKNDPLGLHFRDPVGYSLIVTKVDSGSLVDQWNKDKGGGEKKVKKNSKWVMQRRRTKICRFRRAT